MHHNPQQPYPGPYGPPPVPPRKRRGPVFWIMLFVALPLLVVGGCMAVVISSVGSPTDRSRVQLTGETPDSQAAPHSQAAPAGTEVAVEEDTAAEPSPTPTPPPPAVKPRTYSGSGAKVLRLKSADQGAAWLATMTHDGQSNFVVEGIDTKGDSDDLLVNTIGSYEGTVAFNLEDGSGTAALQIGADGAWKVTLKPLTMARPWAKERVEGDGDDVLLLSPASSGLVTLQATHAGEGNFIVESYSETSTDLLANEIGSWDGEVLLPDGTLLVTVTADGSWSLTRS